VFRESLEYAAESGAKFNGVLCGRATWKDGIPVYAKEGGAAFERWLEDRGVKNITMLNDTLRQAATPWWDVYGGKASLGL
jgi:tagatose 1,6-diphosphate aldolase